MVMLGTILLVAALVCACITVVALPLRLRHIGCIAALAVCVFLLAACGIIVYCFMTEDFSVFYVADYHTDSTDDLAWLYRLSGIWAGKEGSLLFWAFLISVFNLFIAWRARKQEARLDAIALALSTALVAVFVAVLLFTDDYRMFFETPAAVLDEEGGLTGAGTLMGLSPLLESWAMAIHPPLLFIGYSGLVVPFVYALAALITNNHSGEWMQRSLRPTVVSWAFLTMGIAVGSIWAYSILGWGGYWGWDAVENASLLPWFASVALLHNFIVYRRRKLFARWTLFCACATFAFVALDAFITRSGVLGSIHAFTGDTVSLVLFLVLTILPLVVGVVGICVRHTSFKVQDAKRVEHFASKDSAFYFNNVFLLVICVLLAYMTLCPALPEWLPFGGSSFSTTSYTTLAAIVTIAYGALMVFCQLFGWGKTDGKAFWRRAWIPLLCGLAIFVVLLVYQITYLIPIYDFMGGLDESGVEVLSGPDWFVHGIATVVFLVTALLCCSAIYALIKGLQGAKHTSVLTHIGACAGPVAHFGIAVILVGLVGSSLYTQNQTFYLAYDAEQSNVVENAELNHYEIDYAGERIDALWENHMVGYVTVWFDVYDNGEFVDEVTSTIEWDGSTDETTPHPVIVHRPLEDLSITFDGLYGEEQDYIVDVTIKPLVSFIWIGFGLLIIGAILSLLRRRGRRSPAVN